MWVRREFYNLNRTLKISHLVVNGCSYTYGHGIANPLEDAWPSIVAKELGVPLINLAVPGQGNDAIQRRTLRYFYKNLYHDNNPFYIHAYSQSARQEVYIYKDSLNNIKQEHQLLDSSDSATTTLEKEVMRQTDEWAYYLLEEHKMHIWASINALLDSYKVNHLATDYMSQTDGDIKHWIEQYHYNLYAELYTRDNKLENFNEVTKCISKTSCLHETEEGHKCLADYILKQINLRWNSIEVIKEDYAKLSEIRITGPSADDSIRREGIGRTAKAELKHLSREWMHNIYYLNELGIPWQHVNWMGKPETEAAIP